MASKSSLNWRQCDRKSPICDRCKRNDRECVYPERFQFVYGNTTSSSSLTTPECRVLQKKQRAHTYTITTHKNDKDGGLFQKWYRTRLPPEPSLTPAENQSLELVACFERGHVGTRMHWLGQWLTLVPQRIGCSDALDSSARLLASVHRAMLSNCPPSTWVDSRAYIQAIRELRKSLADPIECYYIETLAATTILYYVKASYESASKSNICLTI
jgi:hypothetical protein